MDDNTQNNNIDLIRFTYDWIYLTMTLIRKIYSFAEVFYSTNQTLIGPATPDARKLWNQNSNKIDEIIDQENIVLLSLNEYDASNLFNIIMFRPPIGWCVKWLEAAAIKLLRAG